MYFSNTPISKPLGYADWKADADFNGILWSDKHGFMFEPGDDSDNSMLLPNLKRT